MVCELFPDALNAVSGTVELSKTDTAGLVNLTRQRGFGHKSAEDQIKM